MLQCTVCFITDLPAQTVRRFCIQVYVIELFPEALHTQILHTPALIYCIILYMPAYMCASAG